MESEFINMFILKEMQNYGVFIFYEFNIYRFWISYMACCLN